ncbi:MAG: hypothetical protein IJ708_07515 [Clostridia bacterium]|nr:hypothetical protein [Clostridia bacterium]MBR2288384.1 hypothetical protein [Clostridia bacterium]
MFGRRKKQVMLTWDAGDGKVREMPLEDWEAPEEGVISLSLAFFQDPDPCEIHRGAVAQRVFLSLTRNYLDRGWVDTSSLNAEERCFFPEKGRLKVWENA